MNGLAGINRLLELEPYQWLNYSNKIPTWSAIICYQYHQMNCSQLIIDIFNVSHKYCNYMVVQICFTPHVLVYAHVERWQAKQDKSLDFCLIFLFMIYQCLIQCLTYILQSFYFTRYLFSSVPSYLHSSLLILLLVKPAHCYACFYHCLHSPFFN